MGHGILVCGLNGAGKSTLGKALAAALNFHFIDAEDLYFPKTDSGHPYASPRTHEEAGALFFCEIEAHENFVFASVKGNFGDGVRPFFRYAVLIDVPKEIRMERVRQRSFEKFGDRMLPGGDLYEQEERFFELVRSRDEHTVEKWLASLSCPIIRVDGTKSIYENTDFIISRMGKENSGGSF